MSKENNLGWGIGLVILGLALAFWMQREPKEQRLIVTYPNQSQSTVEVATTSLQKMQGLAHRSALPENGGMIFVFLKPDRYRFWMKDMEFALDFIWLRDHAIVDLRSDVPPPSVSGAVLDVVSSEPFDRVVEVNAGTIQRQQLRIGQRLQY